MANGTPSDATSIIKRKATFCQSSVTSDARLAMAREIESELTSKRTVINQGLKSDLFSPIGIPKGRKDI